MLQPLKVLLFEKSSIVVPDTLIHFSKFVAVTLVLNFLIENTYFFSAIFNFKKSSFNVLMDNGY